MEKTKVVGIKKEKNFRDDAFKKVDELRAILSELNKGLKNDNIYVIGSLTKGIKIIFCKGYTDSKIDGFIDDTFSHK